MRWILIFFVIVYSIEPQAQDLEYVRAKSTLLSSSSMCGRGYVDKGLRKASKVIAKEFGAIGLKPVSDNYKQVFTHEVNTFPSKMKVEVDGRRLEPGVEFLIEANSPSLKGEYKTVLVSAEKLIAKEEVPSAFEDCVIVIELSGDESKEVHALAFELRSQLRMTHPVIWSSEDKLTWSVGTTQLPYPLIEMRAGIMKEGSVVSFDICAKQKAEFKSENLIGMVEGTAYPDSFVVFTAHYDHLGKMGDDAIFNGANDNASGTAFILSLAKHYVSQPAEYSCVFIAFAGEEAGLVGSKYFVDHPLLELDRIRFLINLDLMGSGIDGITVVNAPAVQKEFDLMHSINDEQGYLPQIKSRKQAANSDHYYFAEQGVPAIFIYALGGSTAYHDIFDVSANLTFDEYEDIFRLLTDLVAKF